MKNEKGSNFLIVVLIALIIMMVGLIAYKYNYINIEVSGTSMVPSLNNGDELVANKKATPNRGDIVIINIEETNKWLIKRVIGIEGDTIKIENDKVYLKTVDSEEFTELEEEYALGKTEARYAVYQWTCAEGEFFFLGDNREVSLDSRYYGVRNMDDLIGVVPEWSIKKSGIDYTFNKIVNYPSQLFRSCNPITTGE